MANEQTAEIAIKGVAFPVAQPYAEGHTINAAEAKALNQTRKENISNAVRKKVQELLGDEPTDEAIRSARELVSEYDSGYEFTLASAGGGRRPVDPLEAMAQKVAREYVAAQIKKRGEKVSDYEKEAIAEEVAKVADHPKIIEIAKKRLKLAADDLEL